MDSNSIITIFFISLLFSTSLCEDDEQYTECRRPYKCGTIENIAYPFWGGGRPEYCGREGFELWCPKEDSLPIIEIEGQQFHILKANLSNYNLTIARLDLWDKEKKSSCPESPAPFLNTTLNYTLFHHPATVENITFYYNCGPPTSLPPPTLPTFNCTNKNGFQIGVYANDSYLQSNFQDLKQCQFGVKDPVFRAALEQLGQGGLNIDGVLKQGFEVDYDADRDLWDECKHSGGICGSTTSSPNQFSCFCRDRPYSSECPKKGKTNTRLKIIIAATAFGIVIFFSCVIFLCFKSKISTRLMAVWRKRSSNDTNLEEIIELHGSLAVKRYSFSRVKKMTNSFTNKLGQGGYGSVYKGKLLDGRLVAVKVLNISKGNGEEFINEVASISRTSHVNVVSLLGFCLEARKRALIYEFMPNGSLEKFVYKDNSSEASFPLGWEKLFQIAIGIAQGLEYLHRGCNTRILHFDIKPHNILLDKDFCPKISDFGLAKLCTGKNSSVSMLEARGTIGYIAPEVFNRNFGRVTHKSDVYSYGMMVLETVGARNNKINVGVSDSSEIYFPQWIYNRLALDEDMGILHGVVMNKEENDTVRKMILVGLWCIQTIPSNRPSMSKVIEMLEGSMEALQIPPKPFLSSPSRPSQELSVISTSL